MRSGDFLGIVMLDTRFMRFRGDVGEPETFPFPVRFKTVQGATPERIVGICDDSFLQRFIDAAQELVAEGAVGIGTSCGFLAIYQDQLAKALPVPVLASNLSFYPLIAALLPAGKQVGILTFSSAGLSSAHLAAAGVPADAPVSGLPEGGPFQRAVLDGEDGPGGFALRERDLIEAGRELVGRHKHIGALLCECTNFGPHAAALAKELRLPVYDYVSALTWFWSGLQPRSFGKSLQ
jgi:hypothetical protein